MHFRFRAGLRHAVRSGAAGRPAGSCMVMLTQAAQLLLLVAAPAVILGLDNGLGQRGPPLGWSSW
eukprot:COSAG02_NODE_5771_length_4050_cov_2.519109_4_plen_65_part_00